MSVELQCIQDEVRVWSQRNFGDQASKVDRRLVLNELAPLMGLVEEFGEYEAAKQGIEDGERITDMVDALGDMGIYLLDYLNRCHVSVNTVFPTDQTASVPLAVAIGKLYHTVLKYHQGIRDITPKSFPALHKEALTDVFLSLNHEVETLRKSIPVEEEEWYEWDTLVHVIELVWGAHVVKRNWRTNPTGQNVGDEAI